MVRVEVIGAHLNLILVVKGGCPSVLCAVLVDFQVGYSLMERPGEPGSEYNAKPSPHSPPPCFPLSAFCKAYLSFLACNRAVLGRLSMEKRRRRACVSSSKMQHHSTAGSGWQYARVPGSYFCQGLRVTMPVNIM